MKKAKLDLLEEMPDIELAKAEVQPLEEEQVEEIPVEPGRPWAFNKMLLIGAPVALVALIITGILIYFLYTHTTPPAQKEVATKTSLAPVQTAEKHQMPVLEQRPVAVAVATRTVYIKDFMIDLKDNKGNNRILLCDVAFDVAGEPEQDKLEDSEDVRNIIYRTAQSRGAVALKSVEERKKLKKDLADQLDKLAGRTVVKNVYFIKYFII